MPNRLQRGRIRDGAASSKRDTVEDPVAARRRCPKLIIRVITYFYHMETENLNLVTYSPLAVLNLFNNSISVSQTKRLIHLRGIFQPGKGNLYNGCYYDWLRDESSDALLTIITPALIRNELQSNKTTTLNGFITRRIVNNGSRIDIQFTVTDFVAQTQHKYTDDDRKKIELLQLKAANGYHDLNSWLKEKIINETPFKIGVIIGKAGIIDNDIKHQLRESIGHFDLTFHRVSLTSETEIIAAITELEQQDFDVIVVSRGGGENMEVFNKPSLAEKAIGLKALFLTAIGHKDDITLLQKIADKAFITPSEFGQFLNDTYNHTIEELQHSKAKLVEAITAQLAANYQKQIENLNEKIKGLEDLKKQSAGDLEKVYTEKINGLNQQIALAENAYQLQMGESRRLQAEKVSVMSDQIKGYQAQLNTLQNRTSFGWAAIILAIIIGLIIGIIIKNH